MPNHLSAQPSCAGGIATWLLTCTSFVFGQSASNQPTAFDTTPKEIVFQNDSQWEDNRWQQSDVGPFLAGTIVTGKSKTLKGLAIRVGDEGNAAVCFDTARMRISAAWTGGFLTFGPRRFGLTQPPVSDGDLFFETENVAGWATNGRFKPTRDEINDLAAADGWAVTDNSETRLPKKWSHFLGHYTVGERVILSYKVGQTSVLEMPWFVRADNAEAFTRTLEIAPSQDEMQLWLGRGKKMRVSVIGGESTTSVSADGQSLRVAAHEEPIRFKVLITKPNLPPEQLRALRETAGTIENLSIDMNHDDGRFPDVLTTRGLTSSANAAYVIDTLTLPFQNPWNALLFTAGHDFFSDGSGAICTVHGDVWTVSGIDENLQELRWRRFATGLCQPLGLRIVDDRIYVIGRNQVTRLHDRNGDGEADFHENFNNDMLIEPRAHDFVTCLDTDPEGNFYFIHAKTGVMKLTPDGASLTSVADGFRNPNGMGVSPNGVITAAPQQGTWTPESSLIVVRDGGYYGYGGPRITEERPTGWELPMCFIPRSMDNSGGGQVWVQGNHWGPLEGQMLHLSYGQCRMLLALTEDVDGTAQGGTIQFPTTPGDFESGAMRGRFNHHDGQLYVSGLRGWQTRSVRDGCFQRVRYTGGSIHLPTAVKTYQNGIRLTFAEPLDEETASNPDNYFVQQWNYLWSEQYGSPQFSVDRPQEQGRDDVAVVSATLLEDAHSVFLEMPNRQAVHQINLNWLLRSSAGVAFRGTFAHTINREPTEVFPESDITRIARPALVPPEVAERLKPGILVRDRSTNSDEADVRVSRLMTFRRQVGATGPGESLSGQFESQFAGTLFVPRSGLYDFRIEGTGDATVTINDAATVTLSGSTETAEPLMLRKGHNRISMEYVSPPSGDATVRLLWRGYDFAWEPIPPDALFHDGGDPELVESQRTRHGQALIANHRCANCHAEAVGRVFGESTQGTPNLEEINKRLNRTWLTQWLMSPESLRPSTHMPAVLGQGDHAKQAASDIAAFLLGDAPESETTESRSSEHPKQERVTAAEEDQFETLGCMVCHHFEPPEERDPFDRVSLYYARAKYRDSALDAFLLNPNAHDPATEMPNFRLSTGESASLARFTRISSEGTITDSFPPGDSARGAKLYRTAGCQQCHSAGKDLPMQTRSIPIHQITSTDGCIVVADRSTKPAPEFSFSEQEVKWLSELLANPARGRLRWNPLEDSQWLVTKLRCANCHDRDGRSSQRPLVLAQEGSGRLPEILPSLTWAGEKLKPDWTRKLLAGELPDKSRPWLASRMPAFPAYADSLSAGFAAEHGINPGEPAPHTIDESMIQSGEALTLQTGLDCRQCHAIGDLQPRGDKDTKIALGINFVQIRDRMRRDAYHRFMLDPPRYDINTRMIKLSENGLTTKLKKYFDADAHQQFEAVWQYIQSLPSSKKGTDP